MPQKILVSVFSCRAFTDVGMVRAKADSTNMKSGRSLMRLARVIAICALGIMASAAAAQTSGNATAGAPDPYVSQTTGNAYSAEGAEVRIRATAAVAGAQRRVSTSIKAETLRMHRVRLSAEIDAKNVTGSVTLWLNATGANGVLVSADGDAAAVTGTKTASVDISILVPESATVINAGVVLSGNGDVVARRLRIIPGQKIAAGTPPKPVAKLLLDSAIALVRTHSVWLDTVSWRVVEPQVRRAAAGAETWSDVRPAIVTLLQKTGDRRAAHHTPMRPAPARAGGPSAVNGTSTLHLPLVWSDDRNVASVAFQNLTQPSLDTQREYAAATTQKLQDPTLARSCRWLIDLRNGSGSSVWGALGALKPFLGAGTIGGYVDGNGAKVDWHAADSVPLAVPRALEKLQYANVALLLGPYTSEAAENLAIAFIGRQYTRSFGAASAGLGGEAATFGLPDGSMLTVTTHLAYDRFGVRYAEKVVPEEIVPESGDAREIAIRWLKSQQCH
jgi:carboxyl-terminal processing protease